MDPHNPHAALANIYPGVAGLPTDVVNHIKNHLESIDDDDEFNKLEAAMVSGDFSMWPQLQQLVWDKLSISELQKPNFHSIWPILVPLFVKFQGWYFS